MNAQLVNEELKKLAAALAILKQNGLIQSTAYHDQLERLFKQRINCDKLTRQQDTVSQPSPTAQDYLNNLSRAAGVVISLRSALPTDGDVDKTDAEKAIVHAIVVIADLIKEALATEKTKQ